MYIPNICIFIQQEIYFFFSSFFFSSYLGKCYLYKVEYDHGETHLLGCKNCSCNNGNMDCKNVNCPTLTCPQEQQLSVPNECCKYCPGDLPLTFDTIERENQYLR